MPNMENKGKMQGDMKPEVKDWQTPESAYAEKMNQKPNEYMMREEKKAKKEASKVRGQKFEGRY